MTSRQLRTPVADDQRTSDAWLCEAGKVDRAIFRISVLVAVISIVGVVAGVVMTGRDGSVADLSALVAVGALVVAWRLHRRIARREAVTD
jgi:hypothetical protein